jgi:hypothetical protein
MVICIVIRALAAIHRRRSRRCRSPTELLGGIEQPEASRAGCVATPARPTIEWGRSRRPCHAGTTVPPEAVTDRAAAYRAASEPE